MERRCGPLERSEDTTECRSEPPERRVVLTEHARGRLEQRVSAPVSSVARTECTNGRTIMRRKELQQTQRAPCDTITAPGKACGRTGG